MKSLIPEVSGSPALAGSFESGAWFRQGGVAGTLSAGITAAVDRLLTWQQRSQDRRHLLQLDDHMLADVGLSRADVEHEAVKPFWQA